MPYPYLRFNGILLKGFSIAALLVGAFLLFTSDNLSGLQTLLLCVLIVSFLFSSARHLQGKYEMIKNRFIKLSEKHIAPALRYFVVMGMTLFSGAVKIALPLLVVRFHI